MENTKRRQLKFIAKFLCLLLFIQFISFDGSLAFAETEAEKIDVIETDLTILEGQGIENQVLEENVEKNELIEQENKKLDEAPKTALGIEAINTDKPSPQLPGTNIRIQPTATGSGSLTYKFWVLKEGTGKWDVVQDFSSKDYFDWKPTENGTYRLWVDVKDSTGAMVSKWVYFDVKSSNLGITAINTDKPSPQPAGTNIRIQPTATGAGNLTYKFWVLKEGTGKWDVVQDFSSKDYFDWKPTENGTYRLWVDVKDSTGTMVSKWVYFDVKSSNLEITAINTDIPSPQPAGTNIRIQPTATGSGNLTYRFWILKEGTGKWDVVQDFSTKDYFDWKPTEAGTYRLFIDVKDSTGEMVSRWRYFDVKASNLGISAINTDKPSPQPTNSSIKIKPAATGSGSLTYRFWILKEGTGKWDVVQDFSTKDYFDWKPTEAGTYRLFIDVKDGTGDMVSKWVYFDVIAGVTINSIGTDRPSPQNVNTTIRILPKATGIGELSYKFWVLEEGTGKWDVVQDFSSKNYFDWKPTKSASYRLWVDVKDSTGVMVSKWISFQVNAPLELKGVNTDKPSPQLANTPIRVSADANGTGTLSYKFWILEEGTGTWNVVQDFSSKNYFDWKPSKAGTFRLWVDVKDSTGKVISKWVYYDVSNPISITSIVTDKPSPQLANTTIRITPKVDGGLGGLNYRFWVLEEGTGTWNVVQDFSSKNYYDWKPAKAASYRLWVDVKDTAGNEVNKVINYNVEGKVLSTGYVNGSSVNVRSGPGTNYSVLGSLGSGAAVEIMDSSNPSWHQIKFKGGVGYIHKDFVSFNKGLDYFVDIQMRVLNQTDKDGYWRDATRDEVKYYMDPNNFISNDGKYMFMKLNYSSAIPTSVVNDIVAGKGILSGRGSAFVRGAEKYNVNPLYLACHSRLETGNGSSRLSNGILVDMVDGVPVAPKIVFNMYGIGANDKDPIRLGSEYAYKQGWFDADTAISEGAKWIGENYINNPRYYQDTLYKMKWNVSYNNISWHQYASDIGWAYKQAKMLASLLKGYNNYLEFEIPVFN